MFALLRQRSVFTLVVCASAVVTVPWLGSVGLWDPWETHYAEVGRQMLARGDLVHPFWERAYFFSKPPLVAWIDALALWLSGAQPWKASGDGPLPPSVEWLIRLPIAAMLTLAAALLAEAVARLASRRAGLICGLALSTMPLWFLMARQAMTDGPFVACLVTALACALIAGDAPKTPRRWWLGFFAALGGALLAKGLLAVLPVVALALAWLAYDHRTVLARLRSVPWWGSALTLLIAGPWYAAMIRFDGRDDEGRRFFDRFFLYDHFDRLVNGVHTTTPGGTFTYFIEQGAFAMFPWVALVPAALQLALTPRVPSRRHWLSTAALTWTGLTFALFTSSATRYHHYVLPMLPGVAVLIALAADELVDDVRRFAASLAVGAVLLALVTHDLANRPRHLLDLFTYNHDRPYPTELLSAPVLSSAPAWLTLKAALWLAVSLALVGGVAAVVRGQGRRLLSITGVLAGVLACFVSWKHWPDLGRHWTQRELVSRYYGARKDDEPLGAFLMNWKGETFYSRNQVLQLGAQDFRAATPAFADQPGRKWIIVEHDRVPALRSVIPPTHRVDVVDGQTTNKFALVLVQ